MSQATVAKNLNLAFSYVSQRVTRLSLNMLTADLYEPARGTRFITTENAFHFIYLLIYLFILFIFWGVWKNLFLGFSMACYFHKLEWAYELSLKPRSSYQQRIYIRKKHYLIQQGQMFSSPRLFTFQNENLQLSNGNIVAIVYR